MFFKHNFEVLWNYLYCARDWLIIVKIYVGTDLLWLWYFKSNSPSHALDEVFMNLFSINIVKLIVMKLWFFFFTTLVLMNGDDISSLIYLKLLPVLWLVADSLYASPGLPLDSMWSGCPWAWALLGAGFDLTAASYTTTHFITDH